MNMEKKFGTKNISTGLLIILALLAPRIISAYNLRIFNVAGIYMIFAMSLNLLMGVGGTVSFGHAAFYGIGAYTAAILNTRMGLPIAATIPATIVVSGFAGLLLALPMSRVTGRYVTIVTLGFCEIVNLLMISWESLTRGPNGIMNIPRANLFGYVLKSNYSYYYFVMAMVIIVYTIIGWTVDSKLGRNLKAMRDDSTAAEAMGIKLFQHKIFVFSMSAALAGIAGALYAHFMGYIDPTNFTSAESFTAISIVVVGGLANMKGSIVAALLLMAIPEYLRGFAEYRMLVYGGVLVFIMWVNHSIYGAMFKDYIAERYNDAARIFTGKQKTVGRES